MAVRRNSMAETDQEDIPMNKPSQIFKKKLYLLKRW